MICRSDVFQHLLNEVLGPSVDVGNVAGGVILCDGQRFRIAVHGARTGEY